MKKHYTAGFALLLAAAATMTGCGIIETVDTAGSLAVESATGSTPVTGTDDSSTHTPEQPQPTAEMLCEQLKAYDTALILSPAMLTWCADYTKDATLLTRIQTHITEKGFQDADWYSLTGMTVKVTNDLYSGAAETQSNIHILEGDGKEGITFTFGGDISLADNWHTMQYLKTATGGITDCISPFLIQKMVAADITTLNNEFCFSDRGTAMAGKAWTFRAATANVSVYHQLGVDIVDLANNHVYDFGNDAFLDTLDTLKGASIEYMGAGKDIEEASRPVYYIVEGKKIAYVAATRAEKHILTPAATETTAGVLRCYDPAAFIGVIEEAKQNADFVIANVHWGTENSHGLEDVQPETAYQYIDAGADLIIGTHAHCLQGFEYYKNVPIAYNLGNYWFSHYDIDTGLLEVTLSPDDALELVFYPATQRNCKTTYVGGEAEGERILQALRSYSVNVNIDANGIITQKAD